MNFFTGKYLALNLFLLATLVLAGCSSSGAKKSEAMKKAGASASRNGELSDEAKKYQVLLRGDPDSAEMIFINTQGGPLPALENDVVLALTARFDTQKAAVVNVHQEQTLYTEKFQKAVSFEFAKKADEKSVQILSEIVAHYKNKGKKVYVLGISFGAFMAASLLAEQGPIADGYMIMVGRLAAPEKFWKSFSKGIYLGWFYDEDGNASLREVPVEASGMGGGEEELNRNMARLAAGLGYKRYINLLKDTDLSKIIYVYGDRDNQVGGLSKEEVDFLKERGAKVFLIKDADHGTTINKGYSNILEFPDFKNYILKK